MESIALRGILALTAGLTLAAGTMLQAGGAHAGAADTQHPDFLWAPTSTASNRLYVGNLTWDTSGASTTMQYNPTGLALDRDPGAR